MEEEQEYHFNDENQPEDQEIVEEDIYQSQSHNQQHEYKQPQTEFELNQQIQNLSLNLQIDQNFQVEEEYNDNQY